MDKDRSLLFGVLGISLRHFTADQIQQVTSEWEIEPSRDLPDRLLSAGIITSQVFETLQSITELIVNAHGGDASTALRAFGGETTIIAPIDQPTLTDPFFSAEATSLPEVEGVREFPGRYSDIGEHGRGGFGRVLLVHDSHLDRDIAMKELLPIEIPEMAPEPNPASGPDPNTPTRKTLEVVSRFLREARVTSQLEHPSVVPVYELGRRSDGTLYYTMRFVRGVTLAAAFRQSKTLTARLKLLPHFVDLCNAIAYAHSKGVIHRDIKPGNVMVGDFGETAVLDWGLAKSLNQTETHSWELRETMRAMHVDEEEAVTKTLYGRALGTPAYVSPEQALGRLDEIRERSDVYSLGAVLYELLTGRVPYVGIAAPDVLEKVVAGPPRPVHEVEPLVPPELVAICQKAMAHEAEDRYASAKELADEIQRFLSGALVNAYRYTVTQRLLRYIARRKAVFATAGIAIVILLIVAAVSYVRVVNERDKAIVAQDTAERRLYETSILLASDEVNRRRFDLADENLEAAPPQFRNWEWNYLKRRCHQDLVTLHVPSKPISDVDLSPDKTRLLVASYDGTVRIVDLATWKTLHLFTGFTSQVEGAEFRPDGKHVLIVCGDGTIAVKDADTEADVFTLKNDGAPRWAHYTAEGNRIFTHGSDEPARLWDSATGKELRAFPVPDTSPRNVVISDDGSRVFAFTSEEFITVLDSESGTEIGRIRTNSSSKIAYSAKTQRMVTADRDGQISSWDTKSFTLLGTLPLDLERITVFTLTPDGESVIATGLPGDVYVFRLNPFELTGRYACQSEMIVDARFNSTGTMLVTSSTDHTVAVSDPIVGRVASAFEGHSSIVSGAFFLKEDRKLLSFSEDKTIKVWSMDGTANESSAIGQGHKLFANDAVFSSDGKHVLSFGQDYAAIVWDAVTHEIAFELREHKGSVAYAAWSPDASRFVTASAESIVNHESNSGRMLYRIDNFAHDLTLLRYSPKGEAILGGFADGTLQIWDAVTGSMISTFAGDGTGVQAAVFTPDATRIVAAYVSGRILIWTRENGANLQVQGKDVGIALDLAMGPSGDRFTAVLNGSLTRLFDIGTGALIRQNQHNVTNLEKACYSPSGNRIAVTTSNQTVELLDANGIPTRTLEGHGRLVNMATFSPDSRRVVTASDDATARIWDVETGKELLCLKGHKDRVASGRFSPDGKSIVTASWDKDLRFWSGAPCNPVEIRE